MRRALATGILAAIFGAACGGPRETPLMRAAAHGDVAVIERLVREGARVDERGPLGHTALITAARSGAIESILALVRLGADPDLRGGVNDWTPLMHAIHKGRREAVAALLDAGADPNVRIGRGFTALMMAAGYGDAGTVRLLLSGGADPRFAAPDGSSALAAAVSGVPDIDKFTLGDCQTETVQALLDAAPDLRLPDAGHGRWARRLAQWRNCEEVVRALDARR
jgi:ankyrin repeat protein